MVSSHSLSYSHSLQPCNTTNVLCCTCNILQAFIHTPSRLPLLPSLDTYSQPPPTSRHRRSRVWLTTLTSCSHWVYQHSCSFKSFKHPTPNTPHPPHHTGGDHPYQHAGHGSYKNHPLYSAHYSHSLTTQQKDSRPPVAICCCCRCTSFITSYVHSSSRSSCAVVSLRHCSLPPSRSPSVSAMAHYKATRSLTPLRPSLSVK